MFANRRWLAVGMAALTWMTLGGMTAQALAARVLVDDFEGDEVTNRLGNRANVFIKAPSKAMVSVKQDSVEGKPSNVLMLRYDRQQSGGPYDSGGWCGYYTLLKSPGALVAPTPDNPNPAPSAETYMNAEGNNAITFWVRGETGEENFVVGLSDRHWDRVGDSVKSEEIGKYLPSGKLTKSWQKAVIPLDEFFVDYAQLAAVSIVFEGDLFPETGHAGTVYFDEIVLE
ncbi:MAG: hypothetical protein COV76_00660 [Candidatus Omnitrophica bacterium CG11_big_fil_rev_8_21_14_0_20_64_10]|nr:MAG: hypothetical protein COV76_00660 [Candidatus Omnitrophica bacterium CG11_big_fil_rev_8_21_14_0_20_64_10]